MRRKDERPGASPGLKEAREKVSKARGVRFSINNVARLLRVDSETVRRWEARESKPPVDKLLTYLELLDGWGLSKDEQRCIVEAIYPGLIAIIDNDPASRSVEPMPAPRDTRPVRTQIVTVTPVHANKIQTIDIRGTGFGPPPRTILITKNEGGVDTLGDSFMTSLAIVNLGRGSHRWSAGRASETNTCEIGVKLASWTETRIVLSGFSGPLGPGCRYELSEGDKLRFVVYGPLNQCGPGGIGVRPEEVHAGTVATFDTIVRPPAKVCKYPCHLGPFGRPDSQPKSDSTSGDQAPSAGAEPRQPASEARRAR